MDSSPLIIDINSAKGVIIKFAPRLNLKARQKNIIKKIESSSEALLDN